MAVWTLRVGVELTLCAGACGLDVAGAEALLVLGVDAVDVAGAAVEAVELTVLTARCTACDTGVEASGTEVEVAGAVVEAAGAEVEAAGAAAEAAGAEVEAAGAAAEAAGAEVEVAGAATEEAADVMAEVAELAVATGLIPAAWALPTAKEAQSAETVKPIAARIRRPRPRYGSQLAADRLPNTGSFAPPNAHGYPTDGVFPDRRGSKRQSAQSVLGDPSYWTPRTWFIHIHEAK